MANSLPNPSLVPFVVAVTGHRDIRPQDVDALRREAGKLLAGMNDRMPNTPLLVLTALAEGADQLVAKVALEHGALLASVLPMPLDIYKMQMNEAAQAGLEELRAQAAIEIVLPLSGRTAEELSRSEDARAAAYEDLGVFLTQHGQALIALWDGRVSNKRGGTSSVVALARSSPVEEGAPDTGSRCSLVHHIVTPRVDGELPQDALSSVTIGCRARRVVELEDGKSGAKNGETESPMQQLEQNIERFNRASSRLSAAADTVRSQLVEDRGIPLSPFLVRLETLYGQADAISIRANGWRKLFLSMILVVAIAGTLFYGVHGEMLGDEVWLWFSFAVFVITALALHRAAKARHIEAQYLDARAFAEALRVQFFWEMAGVKQSVDRYYLVNQPTELDWIRYALKNVWLLHQGRHDEEMAAPNYRAVLKYWVKDQLAWYRKKAVGQARSVHRRERISRDALIVAVGWSILIPASLLVPGPWQHFALWKNVRSRDWMFQAFHVALAVPALIAGAYRLWIEQAGYEEQSREYRYMETEFAAKAKELEANLESPSTAEEILLQLGIEALTENGRWLLLHRERPLEVLSTP